MDGASGASVSGCAIQFAYNFGATEILLCGLDMSGDAYFDGSLNVHPNHGDIWPAVRYLNAMFNWLRLRNVNVFTLSPTTLDAPEYDKRMISRRPRPDRS